MEGGLLSFISALWLGILTSISPCPLTVNVVAISFLSKKIVHPRLVLFSGIAYTLGRMFTYAGVGFIIIRAFFSVPALANFLQKYMNKALGPVLIITGLCLLDIIKSNVASFSLSEKRQNILAESGVAGSFILGAFFALVFCPVSAALFFGSLIPLALAHTFGLVMPFIYGFGTGLPVLFFAFAIALSIQSLSRWFNRLVSLERFMRKITGVIFILAGFYYIAIYLVKIGG